MRQDPNKDALRHVRHTPRRATDVDEHADLVLSPREQRALLRSFVVVEAAAWVQREAMARRTLSLAEAQRAVEAESPDFDSILHARPLLTEGRYGKKAAADHPVVAAANAKALPFSVRKGTSPVNPPSE